MTRARAWALPITLVLCFALPLLSMALRVPDGATLGETLAAITSDAPEESATAARSLAGPDVAGTLATAGLSREVVEILLLIPPAFFVTLALRHVVGLETMGNFLPVLLAAAARQTGLLVALVAIAVVALVAGVGRFSLDSLRLLRLPKMGALLTIVVALLVAAAYLGARFDIAAVAHLGLFPIVILTFTVERLSQTLEDDGPKAAVKLLLGTALAISASYVVIAHAAVAALFVAFPELLAVILGAQIALGRYTGMRVTELFRFRRLIFAAEGR